MAEPGVIIGCVLTIGMCGGLITAITAVICAHREKMARIKASIGSKSEGSVLGAMNDLREELARLRDTSTQYDMSLQHTLEQVQHRLTVVESKTKSIGSPTQEEELVHPARAGRV